MITLRQATANVDRYWRKATDEHKRKGRAWYADANALCVKLADYEGTSAEIVAGILAALSPRCSWPENVRATIALVKTGSVGVSLTLPASRAKAWDILQGHPVDDVLGGEKVRAFFDNIMNVEKSDSVTVDTHAARVLFNEHELSTRQIGWIFRRNGNALAQEAYRRVARRYNVAPCVLQATTWLVVKDELTKKPEHEQEGLYIK